jgi:uncharacterized RDD family membrane protein YckC
MKPSMSTSLSWHTTHAEHGEVDRSVMRADHGFVTPEAVPLEMPAATVGSRGAASLVDWMLQGALFAVIAIVAGSALESTALPGWVPVTTVLIVSFLVLFGYPIAFETAWSGGGRTPGKALLGLRVVTVEGAPIRFRHAAIRAALGLIDFWLTFGFAAVVSSLASRRNQRLGDFVAGTVVRRERTGADTSTAQQFAMPHGARQIASSIDTTALRARDYAAIRTYLMRADGLRAERREEIGRQLLDALRERLGGVPDHLPPQVALQAVAASYQERHRVPSDGLTSAP